MGQGGIWRSKVSESDKSVIIEQKCIKVTIRTLFGEGDDSLGVLRGVGPAFTHLFQDIPVLDAVSCRPESVFLTESDGTKNRPIRRQEFTSDSGRLKPGPRAASGGTEGDKVVILVIPGLEE